MVQEGASAEELISRRLDRPQQCCGSQPSVRTHWNFVCELTNRPGVRRACAGGGASRLGAPPSVLLGAVCAPPTPAAKSRSRKRFNDSRQISTRERVSVSKNEQSASQACLTLQCTAFLRSGHIKVVGDFKEGFITLLAPWPVFFLDQSQCLLFDWVVIFSCW